MIVSWNKGAEISYAAIRGRVEDDGRIFLHELISSLVLDTPPNGSLLGRVLRDPTFFLAAGRVTAKKNLTQNEADHANPFSTFALEIERIAEREHVRTVGERHVARLLIELGRDNRFGRLGLNPQSIHDEVRRLEIGPDFRAADLVGWHGIIDTNIVLKSRQAIPDINWRDVANEQTGPVTIWVSTVTLHELDTLPLYHRESWVRQKARNFAVWFNERIKTKADFHEIALGNDVKVRFWKASPGVTPDTQILESASSLRDKGLDIRVITHDTDVRLRALDDDFQVVDLPSSLLADTTQRPPT